MSLFRYGFVHFGTEASLFNPCLIIIFIIFIFFIIIIIHHPSFIIHHSSFIIHLLLAHDICRKLTAAVAGRQGQNKGQSTEKQKIVGCTTSGTRRKRVIIRRTENVEEKCSEQEAVNAVRLLPLRKASTCLTRPPKRVSWHTSSRCGFPSKDASAH